MSLILGQYGMYFLKNKQLQVEVLDPIEDQSKFGVRYCTGGYIYQVTDKQLGALLSGPTYPDSFNWFDGQGIPDAFNWAPLRSAQKDDSEVLIIGVGLCDLQRKQVKSFCEWQVEVQSTQLSFTTQQSFENYAFQLIRTLTLQERSIRSHTLITNHGAGFIPISWFPHPFFPQPLKTAELCYFNIPVQLKTANQGYELGANGFIRRKAWPEQKGFYLALEQQAQQPLSILQRHDDLGLMGATCSYVPSYLPIWGNQHTFSWEPFLQTLVAPTQTTSWWIDYHF